MNTSFNLEKTLNQLKKWGDWVGLREVRQITTYRSARNDRPESCGADFSHGLMVEVLINGQFGYAATHRLTQEAIDFAANRACKMAQAAIPFQIFPFQADQARPPARGSFRSPGYSPLDSDSEVELMQILLAASRQLQVNDKIVHAEASGDIVDLQVNYVSSSGAKISQEFLLASMSLTATAQEGIHSQTRSDHGERGLCYQSGMEVFTDPSVNRRAKKTGEQALELLTAMECPTGKMDLVLMPDQMMLQIHESIGHPLELDRILGDERNYAGFSFVRPQDFGQLQYGSQLMNVTFDPTYQGEFASYNFDDAGLPAAREFLIKDGLLIRGLGGKESQLRSGLAGVANFRASSWNRAPIDRMANLNLEPGTSSLNEMIANVEYGVLMEANRSWSIDDYRNKFQFGCEYGQLIENGQITKTLKNPNYRGLTTPFWNNLHMVGDQSTFEIYGTPFCGKGEPNQVIRVGHGSPACLFTNVEVFGGQA